tara:strand:+ start:753 stop:2576 length:1824 start_codon:yes stop_codon:yes gene_type:complete
MKFVTFKRLTIKNFLSVGDDPVVINFEPGLHIITGINKDKIDRRNGVGKSTIADALYFTIFGKTLRDIKKEFIQNNITSSKCEVALELNILKDQESINYKIVRVLNPTKCYIYKNDEDITRDCISNTTEYINKLLCTSEEVFQNCVIMTVNNTTPFMAKKKIEKRKFIEGILNLEVFSDMIKTLRSEYNDIRRNLDIECTKYDESELNLNSYKEQKDIFESNKKAKHSKYLARQSSNLGEIDKLETSLKLVEDSSISQLEQNIVDLTNKLDSCDQKIISTSTNITSYKTKISMTETDFNNIGTSKSKCPTCLRSLKSDDREHIKKEKDKLRKRISRYTDKIVELQETDEKLEIIKTTLRTTISNNQTAITDIKVKQEEKISMTERLEQLSRWQDELGQDLEELAHQTNQFDNLINTASKRFEEVQVEIENIKDQIKTLDVVKFVVSEEGVKSYIVRKILKLLNNKLGYYLKAMDANCICMFNEYFEEQIVDDKGKICSYFNFSGAERKNIDLACLFTFMDIRRLQGDVAFNVSMYDELFDSSLDEKGVQLVINILRERLEKYNECMMVISHRKESTKIVDGSQAGAVIFLEKKNGITRKVEFKNNNS